jgi:hypothetical protein
MLDYAFPVELKPIAVIGGMAIPNMRAVVRTDTGVPLSTVSDRYHLFTHQEAVDATQGFLKTFGEFKEKTVLERTGQRFVRECTFQTQALKVKTPKVDEVAHFRLSIVNSYDCKSSLRINIGAMVLRCLNGMTVPGGELDLSFRHTGSIRNLELPEPDTVLKLFGKAGETWNNWADERLNGQQRDSILESSIKMQVIGPRLLEKHRTELEPDTSTDITFWEYFNNFTRILTHEMPKVQLTKKFTRMDRLNTVFDRVLHGTPEVGFSDEEHE